MKCAVPRRSVSVHLFFQGRELIGGNTTISSVTQGQCDARPTVTFSAGTGTKLMPLVTETHV